MKISYNWLKKYISIIDISENKISNILTDIGLSVKSIKKTTIENDKDSIMDIEVTPNRSDAMSHYGIARDLYACLTFRGYKVTLLKPIIKNYKKDIDKYCFQILIEEKNKCKRYSGVVLSKIKVDSSPNWLINRLKSIGIKSINNVMDIKNFVMHELGQPIQVFDMDQIKGDKIIIKNVKNKVHFRSEDHIKRELNEQDLIISDTIKPLSIAGIISSHHSNINTKTKNIFLGSAYFNPIEIRSIGIRHLIKTEDRLLFEKGVDPNQTVYVLQRAATLIKKITKCQISSDIVDVYPHPISPFKIKLHYKKIIDIIGKRISKNTIKKILSLLEIVIHSENEKLLLVFVPPYRIDVQREIDLIEEILRIYGMNRIKESNQIQISSVPTNNCKPTEDQIQKIIFNQLVNYGFQEIINPPMINKKSDYFLLNSFSHSHRKIKSINIINPTNKYYNSMRPSLLFGMIDSIKYNYNRGNNLIKFFEFGKIYYRKNNQFLEKTCLSIAVLSENLFFFFLKGIIEQIFQRIGITHYTQKHSNSSLLKNSISIQYKNKNFVELGKVEESISKKKEIFYAEIDWEYLISIVQEKKIIFVPYSKYPTSRRDLSLLIDQIIPFEKIYQSIKKMEKNLIKKIKLIKEIKIYDFYKGENLPISKKSYTISVFFESHKETLTDVIINEIMKKIEKIIKNKLGAKIRGVDL
ncbi:MAG: phenylalanine--tRNA ligase subunit beta [Flavobacteriales bacterium]|jgi:phenylalanyl-tRNA synthetase beta chain|uniref:phenylalanine--tRNA ligase subunit beta n=1 Tax=Blattabacterium sp. (Mastotermes darwiniensis) TaxID=39768 RepID=UPI000231DF15|nr:phenylalanine--tRNA ligase subunit beta [Blattabacterium sp. (Mastotermes darwiniensis)]AER40841.1 phenylalanyl-tRNA synthetase beta subunit [Blattabacterium sp. (Mastotermes darwiniensis) str. MADAR]MDR1804688.1 phenylalanine--tRNA ligase subunit beta [Flavobacteriales bacterium]